MLIQRHAVVWLILKELKRERYEVTLCFLISYYQAVHGLWYFVVPDLSSTVMNEENYIYHK